MNKILSTCTYKYIYANSPRLSRSVLDTDWISWSSVWVTKSLEYKGKLLQLYQCISIFVGNFMEYLTQFSIWIRKALLTFLKGWEGKIDNCPRLPIQAVLKILGTVFPNVDWSRLASNMFISSLCSIALKATFVLKFS